MLDTLQSAWHDFWSIPHLMFYLTAAWVVYLVPLCGWIVLQKREPAATISWVLSLALLPYLGYLIYFLFGPQKIKRQRLRRHVSRAGMESYGTSPAATGPDATELGILARAITGLPASGGNRASLLVDGAATYDAILEAIATASDHVHLEYYIYEPDQTGTKIRDALVERARAGVKVRLLLDAVGSMSARGDFLEPLLAAGGEVGWFHPTGLRLFSRPWVNLRTHRKIVVVDGRVAFTGGLNVTDEQDERLHPRPYRDLHLCLQGEVIRGIQIVFVEDWFYATGQTREHLENTRLWRADHDSPGSLSAQVLPSGPDSSWEAIHRLHVSAIHEAHTRVWLATPYFVPGEAARMALTSAALGGLDVRLLVPKQSDSRLVTYAARSYFDELLAAGIKVYEYGPRLMHSKALLCDDEVAIIGSANFDHRSFRLNFEISMLLQDRDLAATLEAQLEQDFAAAERVQDERNRSFWRNRLPEALARLLSPLL